MKTAEEWRLEFERCEDAAGFVSTDDERRIIRAIQADARENWTYNEIFDLAIEGNDWAIDMIDSGRWRFFVKSDDAEPPLIPTAPGTPRPGDFIPPGTPGPPKP